MKRRLSEKQEFEIMKLILDKFLWIGFAVMVYGLWQVVNSSLQMGFVWIIIGAILLLLFTWIITKEYEIIA